jgi:MftR C-terminal domain/Transcriptional regulator PadR-like family
MASSYAASPGAAGRPLTDFEQVLLAVIASEPRSGYGLKKMFSSSPASVYQPSPAALYQALRRLEARTGTDLEQDMYPRILAGAVIAAAQVAVRRWSAADPPVPLGPLLRRALEQLATVCSGVPDDG